MATLAKRSPGDRGSRLRVVHLLGWTLGCALGFAAYQGLTPRLNLQVQSFGEAYNAVMGMAFGTILAGAGVLAHRRWRGDTTVPSLPGHWLLLFGIAAAFANGAA